MDNKQTICVFGYHLLGGARHWVITTGLKEHGYKVIECRTEKRGFLPKYIDLYRKYWKLRRQVDVILVPFPGHFMMPLAWLLGKLTHKPIVFDVFVSLYDTQAEDRKLVRKTSIHAKFLSFMDWLSCRLADVVLIDTELHKQYFVERYRVPEKKILVIPVGCRTDIFKPMPQEKGDSKTCTVLFHGTFIPLQGIEVILKAAEIIQKKDPSIKFQIIGKGQTYKSMRELTDSLRITNVTYIDYQPMEILAQYIANADICLGIFGTSKKAQRVIPHKVYDILCMDRPLITSDTLAARRTLINKTHALLTPSGDKSALAEAIFLLKGNDELRQKIAYEGNMLFQEKFLPHTIVEPLSMRLDALRPAKK